MKISTYNALYQDAPHYSSKELIGDAIDLFLGKKQGHMERWEYGSSNFSGDPAGGAEHWASLVKNPGNYYLTSGDIRTIEFSLKQFSFTNIISGIETVVELGPGSYDSICKKTLPFLKLCTSLQKYVAIDMTVEQAKGASDIVDNAFSIQTSAIGADYFAKPLRKRWDNRCAIIMWGSSLGNIDGSAGENPVSKLTAILNGIKNGMQKNDLLVLCFDTESDGKKVIAAYSELSLRSQILSILFRLKRDGHATGNFDPKVWCHEPVWFQETGQCAHTIFPMFDQEINLSGMTLKIPAWRRFISNNSYKFSPNTMNLAAKKAGIEPLFCLQNSPIAMFVGTV